MVGVKTGAEYSSLLYFYASKVAHWVRGIEDNATVNEKHKASGSTANDIKKESE